MRETTLEVKCRYCGVDNDRTDIYLVARNGRFEGFCLPCYEKHLDDKRNWKRDDKQMCKCGHEQMLHNCGKYSCGEIDENSPTGECECKEFEEKR